MGEETGELPLKGWDFTVGKENPPSRAGEGAKEETAADFFPPIQRN